MVGRMANAAPLDRSIDLTTLSRASGPSGTSLVRMLKFERRWLVRVFEELLPSGADERLAIGAADVPMGRFVDDLLAHSSVEFALGLRLCMWLVMLAPLFVLRRFRTFFGLSPSDKAMVLERLRGSSVYIVREAPMLLKTIGCLGFCGLPPVQHALGIHPIDTSPPSWAAKSGSEP